MKAEKVINGPAMNSENWDDIGFVTMVLDCDENILEFETFPQKKNICRIVGLAKEEKEKKVKWFPCVLFQSQRLQSVSFIESV